LGGNDHYGKKLENYSRNQPMHSKHMRIDTHTLPTNAPEGMKEIRKCNHTVPSILSICLKNAHSLTHSQASVSVQSLAPCPIPALDNNLFSHEFSHENRKQKGARIIKGEGEEQEEGVRDRSKGATTLHYPVYHVVF
jgi:hypothetical protein